jgi:pimeloyl-ACP methyl ester carboxylesterase
MPYARNAIDGTVVHFEDDGGVGAPVVVLGGFVDTIPLVRRTSVVMALRESSQVLRLVFVDHRGHGGSGASNDPAAYAMPLRVADVVAVLDELSIDRAAFVGLSWGGRLALGIGEHAPARVRSLVVIGQHPYAIDPEGPLARAVGTALEASAERGIAALVEAFEAIAGRYPDEVRDELLAADAGAMRAAFTAAIDEGPVSRRLEDWRIPCLFGVAEGDTDFFERARHASEEIPNARFVVIGGTDHLGADTAQIGPLRDAILDLLRETA